MSKNYKLGMATIAASLLLIGCSTDSSIDGDSKINILGTWNYSYQHSLCGDLTAEGIEIIESNNGNTSEVGEVLVQGTMLALNPINGGCYLRIYDNYIDSSYFVGSPSNEEEEYYMDKYLRFFQVYGSTPSYIESSTVHSYTSSLISFTLNHEDGTTSYLELTKQ